MRYLAAAVLVLAGAQCAAQAPNTPCFSQLLLYAPRAVRSESSRQRRINLARRFIAGYRTVYMEVP